MTPVKIESAVRINAYKIDSMEQCGRRENLQISGIKGEEDTDVIFIDLASEIGIDIKRRDINVAHRLDKKGEKPKHIIVIFVSRESIFRILNSKKNLGNIDRYKGLYIFEDLTPLRRRIFVKLRRSDQMASCFSREDFRLNPYLPYLIGFTAITGIILATFGDHYVFVTVDVDTARDRITDIENALVKETTRVADKTTTHRSSIVEVNGPDGLENTSKAVENATIGINKVDIKSSSLITDNVDGNTALHKRKVVINSINRKVDGYNDNCTFEKNGENCNVEGNDNAQISQKTLPPPEYFSKFTCNITISEEMDLMKMKKLPFIERFKNPCWYDQENKLKCLPYLHIVGVAKSGTTDLFKRITLHPDVIAPARKEPNWLTEGRFYRQESFDFYISNFFAPIAEVLSKVNGTSNLITADASVFDLHGGRYWPWLCKNVGHDEPVENNAEYIYNMNSQARIIVNIRNPIDRLWSEYLALSQHRNLSAEGFHEIVKTAIRVYDVCQRTRTLRSCMYDTPLSLYASLSEKERHTVIQNCRYHGLETVLLARGVYHVFIKDYLKVFPREHVLIQRLEDISNDTESALVRTYRFLDLGIPPETRMKFILSIGKQNPRRPSSLTKGDMLESTRWLLYEFYKPHNEQLSILLGDSKFNYGPRG